MEKGSRIEEESDGPSNFPRQRREGGSSSRRGGRDRKEEGSVSDEEVGGFSMDE